MATWSRDTALLTMTSPLGQDVLIPYEFSAREGISEPFLFEIHAFSQQGIFDPDKLLHQMVCVKVQHQAGAGVVRYFNGIAQSVSAEGGSTATRAGCRAAATDAGLGETWNSTPSKPSCPGDFTTATSKRCRSTGRSAR